MANHESYNDYKPQQPLGRSGGLSVETFYSEQSKTTVVSPIVPMQCGLPAQVPVVRPQRTVHPYFLNGQDPSVTGAGIPSSESEGSAIGKAVASLAEGADVSDFSYAEIGELAALADLAPGEGEGYTNLDVWD